MPVSLTLWHALCPEGRREPSLTGGDGGSGAHEGREGACTPAGAPVRRHESPVPQRPLNGPRGCLWPFARLAPPVTHGDFTPLVVEGVTLNNALITKCWRYV